jgi:alkylhydroperoxidase family enzyme
MADVQTIHTGKLDFDIDAREAEVIGTGQRIAPLKPDEITGESRALCVELRKSFRNQDPNFIPEIIATMLRHPGLYRCQMEMSLQLVTKSTLSPRERELAILRVGWLCRAPFEWGQHVNIAKRFGMTSEEMERVTEGSAAPGWNAHERAILRAVEELLGDQFMSDETWNELAKSWSEAQLMELPVLVGIYYMTALQQNAIRAKLQEDNIGLRQR